MKNPKVSVIVPVYKAERTLARCVDSILAQTYIDIELLLIDDGSPDNSGVLCDEYAKKDSRVRVFHKPNGGVSSARNLGLDNAYGQWIIFCDADDYWTNNTFLEHFFSIIFRNDIDIIRGEYIAVDIENKEIIPPGKKNNKHNFANRVLSPYDFIYEVINGEYFTPLIMMRQSFIGKVRFNENQIFLEDMDFFIQLFTKDFKGYYCPIIFYAYVKQSESISHKKDNRKLRDSFIMCDRFYNLSHKLNNEKLKDLYIYDSIMMYYWTLQTLAEDTYYKDRYKIIQDLNLTEVHKDTLSRINGNYRRYSLYLPFIFPTPSLGVKLLYYKDKLIRRLQIIKQKFHKQ